MILTYGHEEIYAPWKRQKAELELFGKDETWLKSECKRLQELVLGGPVKVETEIGIEGEPAADPVKAAEPTEQSQTRKMGKLVQFPNRQKTEAEKVNTLIKSLNPTHVAVVLEYIRETCLELVEGMSEESAILRAAAGDIPGTWSTKPMQ